MIIPINPKSTTNPLPPGVVKLLGSDEVVLLELQGSLATQGDIGGGRVGVLDIDADTKVSQHRLINPLGRTHMEPAEVADHLSSLVPESLESYL